MQLVLGKRYNLLATNPVGEWQGAWLVGFGGQNNTHQVGIFVKYNVVSGQIERNSYMYETARMHLFLSEYTGG